jgi:hypothetical protein
MSYFVALFLKRGNFEDVDIVSGMSLLHFAAVSGAHPVGSDQDAALCVTNLIRKVNFKFQFSHVFREQTSMSCRCTLAWLPFTMRLTSAVRLSSVLWSQRSPARLILSLFILAFGRSDLDPQIDIDMRCEQLQDGSALHVAVSRGQFESVKVRFPQTLLFSYVSRRLWSAVPPRSSGTRLASGL